MSKPLALLLKQLDSPRLQSSGTLELEAYLQAQQVQDITCDSRQVSPGSAFFCLEGDKFDGHNFVEEAIAKGAICIFTNRPSLKTNVPTILVNDTRIALAKIASAFYDHPSTHLRVIGVTGTNGKTTTTHLVEHILLKTGNRAGLIGTLGARWLRSNNETAKIDFGQTTPQAAELQRTFASMLKDNISHVAMEVSSHSLSLNRVTNTQFATACLTNITQDHLDFHKTMMNYSQAKLSLFELLNESTQKRKTAVINLDDPLAEKFLATVDTSRGHDLSTFTYSWHHENADLKLKEASFDFKGSRLVLSTPQGDCELKLHLNGPFNVYNVMAALAICLSEEIELADCKSALEDFEGVPGRFQIVSNPNLTEPLCIIDYAHTPDGLANILTAARVLVPDSGQLIVVFGCGGDRDNSKRPQMGAIAEKLADRVIVTSDNPRSEDPQKIIAEILAGINRLSTIIVEPDRAKAIRLAVLQARPTDVIVIAGKGHENYQILANRTIDFDDRLHVQDALHFRQ